MTVLIIVLPLISSFCRCLPLPGHVRQITAILWLYAALSLSIMMFTPYLSASPWAYTLLDLGQDPLTVMLASDAIARVMSVVVLFIGLIIHAYSERYMRSDTSLRRFQCQIGLCLSSVLLFVNAANLLTAFLGWQMIGLALYVLLNHYHFDLMANRAAKKKFTINRLGDVCFLMALVIVHAQGHSGLFSEIETLQSSTLVGLLLIVAVMTKSAQFPFHIWLPDTMEAPTPVSALMHAGIINAGGILLARLFPLIRLNDSLMAALLVIGGTTVFFGALFTLNQYDIKRKLAYSTMGQMGYMVMQVGLGYPAAAMFHLIAHGFFKASLFLNAGDPAVKRELATKYSAGFRLVITGLALVSAGAIVMLGWQFNQLIHLQWPLLLYTFLGLTLAQLMIWRFERNGVKSWPVAVVVLTGALLVYLGALKAFHVYLALPSHLAVIAFGVQVVLSVGLVVAQLMAWFKPFKRFSNRWPLMILGNVWRDKAYIESLARAWLLQPLRRLGDGLMAYSRQHYLVAAGLLGTIGCAPIILSHAGGGSSLSGHDPLISWAVLTALLVSLIIANRANSLLGIFAWVAVFELLLGVLQWTFHYHHELTWFVFHFVNATPLLIMLGLIGYQVQLIKNKPDARHCENALSWRLFYLSAGFVLLMAIPGSASFIDMYTLMYVTYMHDWTVMVGVSIVLLMLAITVLHALQTYVFGSQFNALMGRPVSKFMHGFCWAVIALNGIAGLAPSQFLTLF